MGLLVALLAGAVIGLLLGALGGGGSILTVPVLVYGLGQGTATATTASLVIVGVTSIVAAAEHHRCGRVRWGPGLVFGLLGSLTALLGSLASHHVPPAVLLLGFAVLMLVAAAGMVHRDRRTARTVRSAGNAAGAGGGTAVATRHRSTTARRTVVVAAALGVGLLTGFFGVGGGFVIVPALVLALELPMPVAAATSLVVIALNSGAGLLARWGHVDVPWRVVLPFTAAAVATSLLGGRVAQHVPARVLTRGFVALLVLVAAYVAVQAGTSL
ncbi:sulfite exporter TauE/SafE family protein [Rhodococcus aerolatus]